MVSPVDAAKTAAKVLKKQCLAGDTEATARVARFYRTSEEAVKLKHCQFVVAKEQGFDDWSHLNDVFAGSLPPEADVGQFWYSKGCGVLMNHWCSSYEEALSVLNAAADRWLFPFKRQYVVGDLDYIKTLGLDSLKEIETVRDFVAASGSSSWLTLAAVLIRYRTEARPVISV